MKTVIAEFTINAGQEKDLMAACEVLLNEVEDLEKGTWLYLINIRKGTHSDYLVFFEAYADQAAFDQHLGPDSPWARFSCLALKNGWLEEDKQNPTGFKTKFSDLEQCGSLIRSSGRIGT